MSILITGVNSGLGRHCLETFNGTGCSRDTSLATLMQQAEQQPFNAIIHAAFNTKPVNEQNLYQYINDNIFFTEQLLKIPHQKFIFISSIDVYPKNGQVHTEKDEINVNEVANLYATTKLMSESMVRQHTKHHLILRASALLGRYARPNSLIKMLTQLDTSLSLASTSIFNYVLHADVSAFIKTALTKDLTGTYNITAASNITLAEVAKQFDLSVNFGSFQYQTDPIDNTKTVAVCPLFKKTSLENIIAFQSEFNSSLLF